LRINEQETRLTLQEHDDDDELFDFLKLNTFTSANDFILGMPSYMLSSSSDTHGFYRMLGKLMIFFFISVPFLSVVLVDFI
jgi:hypothetical protein